MAKAAWIAQQTDARFVRELFPVRKRDTHKGDYGKVLLLCGSEGLTGAARLAAKAALRTGSGLVYLGVPEKIYPIVAAASGSEIVFPLPCDGKGRLSLAALEPIGARMEDGRRTSWARPRPVGGADGALRIACPPLPRAARAGRRRHKRARRA